MYVNIRNMVYTTNRRKNYNRRRKRYGYYNRKRYRKFGKGKPTTLVTYGPKIVPDRYMCKLTYTISNNYTSEVGVPLDQVIRGNSLYDPDATGFGGQPTGLDQIANLYYQYTVLASKVKFSAVNTNANAAEMVLVPDTNVNGETSIELLQTRPYAKTRLLAPSGSGGALQVLKHYMTSARMYGKPRDAIISDNQFSALTSATPTEQYGWHCFVEPVNTGSPIGISYQVLVTYYAIFYDRIPLAAS